MNIQPIEKRDHRTDGLIDVHSIFCTIQGEGPFCGHRAIFIRLAGCNLQCPGCDTIYTGTERKLMLPGQILGAIHRSEYGTQRMLVVITGGEPFRQNITELIELLVGLGYNVQIETNGTLRLDINLYHLVRRYVKPAHIDYDFADTGLYIVVSPKTGRVHGSIETYACAYKYVISARDFSPTDLLPNHALDHSAEPFLARPGPAFSGVVYVQPRDYGPEQPELSKQALKNAVHACQRAGYILQLQVHKLIGVE